MELFLVEQLCEASTFLTITVAVYKLPKHVKYIRQSLFIVRFYGC